MHNVLLLAQTGSTASPEVIANSTDAPTKAIETTQTVMSTSITPSNSISLIYTTTKSTDISQSSTNTSKSFTISNEFTTMKSTPYAVTTTIIFTTTSSNEASPSRVCPPRQMMENCDLNCVDSEPVCTGNNQGSSFSSFLVDDNFVG